MQANNIRRTTTAVLLAGLTGAAQAHGGHGPHELWDMLTHAFGVEQLLVLLGLVAVGVAVRRWRARRAASKSV
jgi:urease accessory protein